MRNFIVVFIFLFIINHPAICQDLPVATNFKAAYLKQTRDKSGSPGKNYWQNKTDYVIKISFDPHTRNIAGNVGIDYINNSPDTLKQLVFKLYPNFYQAQAMRNMPVAPEDLTKGIQINTMSLNGHTIDSAKRLIRGTNMYVRHIDILPGAKVHLDISYTYSLNKGSFIRTGQVDTGAFMIAYFFPRVAVYDDIDGWNEYPYIGKEEFYNDFCDFKVEITVPGTYQVWATGELQNPEKVYTPKFVKRIATASKSDSVTDVITEADIKSGDINVKNNTNTWKFKANNETDFAFATSNHYVWKASGISVDPATHRRTRVDAVYNPQHKSYDEVVSYARKTVELISYKIPGIPFPYSHESIFDGLDAMEYPMMVNDLPFEKSEAVEFTAHEVFHSLFPFFVGTNETKYSFMDEGWATFAEFTLGPKIRPDMGDDYDLSPVNSTAGTDQDVPIMTLTPQLYGKARFSDKDLKPALGLRYLREMLGDPLFFKAVKYYIGQWQGKHPTPYDFFNCMNNGAGINLNWFWKNWFFEKNVPDLAIAKVNHQQQKYAVTIANEGTEIVPVHLTVYYSDGSNEIVNRSISCWSKGNQSVVLKFTAKNKVLKLVLGTAYDVDVNPGNNTWKNIKK